MHRPVDPILTVAQMRAAEQTLIDSGETVWTLMQRAGHGAADIIWRICAGRSVTVLTGPGNNGGDGYVIAESLRRRGAPVKVIAAFDPKTEAAQQARAEYQGEFAEGAEGEVFVDSLFGSGLTRGLGTELADRVRHLAARHRLCVAIDLPSGVESDHAAPLDPDLPHYDCTISLGAWKCAHWMMPAMEMMGRRELVPIGIGETEHVARLFPKPELTVPSRNAHKYSRGLLALVGGEMPGAGVLAAQAAMRSGAGYVKLFSDTPPSSLPAELVIDRSDLDEALDDHRLSALAIGPGLGRSGRSRNRLAATLGRDVPTLCDADALVLLRPAMLEGRKSPVIFTPHAGELDRLFTSFDTPEGGRLERLLSLARASGAVIVAKGPDTIVAAPDGRVAISPPAPSWLSVAGTGDVLAGIIASRLATGCSAMDAACQGVWLHGEAACQAGAVFTAGELVSAIRSAYAACL
ncbi:NAD(P)H-hydrate dehydratase [Altericroceibacterium spongiae]|uniref:ADP-dependent (S)-NAD(P)H-hydrate dehydratase n=1 Tax=Altericroceibacterium spongiae TaxID=2320269 RepID=A0A420ERD5_9SPHN|nr:NAD(P)H-hydrate dehydratase [Altericroceibacterium spongiae]RKF23231.1 NAD(P)H-hydrate dehydratase [Altericroceibacterium spongiae]